MKSDWIFVIALALLLALAVILGRPIKTDELQACREMNKMLGQQLQLTQPKYYPR